MFPSTNRPLLALVLALTATACTPIDLNLADCARPGTCTVVARTCCGTCGDPTLGDVTAVATARVADQRKAVCGDQTASGCPACPTRIEPNLYASCRSGSCVAVDLRQDELSRCATDGDCVLRYGVCCECGQSGDVGLVALRADGVNTLVADLCAPDTACAACAPIYPTDRRASCDATTHHCAVVAQ